MDIGHWTATESEKEFEWMQVRRLERLKAGRRWRTRGTKGDAPFSAAMKDKGNITPKVPTVNVYLSVIQMNAESVGKTWLAGPQRKNL